MVIPSSLAPPLAIAVLAKIIKYSVSRHLPACLWTTHLAGYPPRADG
jgi:hypothetical protein